MSPLPAWLGGDDRQRRRREEVRLDTEADIRTGVVLARLEQLADRFQAAADRIDLTLEDQLADAETPRGDTPGGAP